MWYVFGWHLNHLWSLRPFAYIKTKFFAWYIANSTKSRFSASPEDTTEDRPLTLAKSADCPKYNAVKNPYLQFRLIPGQDKNAASSLRFNFMDSDLVDWIKIFCSELITVQSTHFPKHTKLALYFVPACPKCRADTFHWKEQLGRSICEPGRKKGGGGRRSTQGKIRQIDRTRPILTVTLEFRGKQILGLHAYTVKWHMSRFSRFFDLVCFRGSTLVK